MFYHGLAISVAALSVLGGVATIERVNKIIVPALLVLLIFSFYWAIFLPYASEGITFLFSPGWSKYGSENGIKDLGELPDFRGQLN